MRKANGSRCSIYCASSSNSADSPRWIGNHGSAKIMVANPSRILVISLRRIGDLLLTTPLIRSLRRAWPDASIDVLVFANTAGIVEGNPDINRIIAMPPRPALGQSAQLLRQLWRQYDI